MTTFRPEHMVTNALIRTRPIQGGSSKVLIKAGMK